MTVKCIHQNTSCRPSVLSLCATSLCTRRHIVAPSLAFVTSYYSNKGGICIFCTILLNFNESTIITAPHGYERVCTVKYSNYSMTSTSHKSMLLLKSEFFSNTILPKKIEHIH